MIEKKEQSRLKKFIKGVGIFFAVIFLLLFLFILCVKYMVSWRLTDVAREVSPDGRYSLLFQEKGEADFPFGSSHGKVTLFDGEEKVNKFFVDIADDGGAFRPANFNVEWMPAGVIIIFSGSEQADEEVDLLYDGDVFTGYSEPEIEDILRSRYGLSGRLDMQETSDPKLLKVILGDLSFYVKNDMALHNGYYQELFKKLSEEYFLNYRGRGFEWETEEGETPADVRYTPVISMYGPGKQDLESFCYDVCAWLATCFEKLPYDEAPEVYSGFIPDIYGYERVKYWFQDNVLTDFYENDTYFYNALYMYLDRFMDEEKSTDGENASFVGEADETADYPIDAGTLNLWASIDADAEYVFNDGTRYALVPVDRALGSSYYVLMAFPNGASKEGAYLVNDDPYNGSGGGAGFITFVDDSDLGFSCLTYSGGSEGILYMTRDKGKSFVSVDLPSPMIKFQSGKMYNPFVMPERAWAVGDTVYIAVGQGPDGDYYNETLGGKPVGIYATDDKGESFRFVREELRAD
ncbi:MAG: hypothetical protein K6D96_04665 [Acetatifactor sp.]|nr:hypothetical protein [Acetatifactor sp.]